MKNDIEWYAKADLSKYRGKYVAILDKKVVASGINAKKVIEEAKRKYPRKESFLVKVRGDETLVLSLNIGVKFNGIEFHKDFFGNPVQEKRNFSPHHATNSKLSFTQESPKDLGRMTPKASVC